MPVLDLKDTEAVSRYRHFVEKSPYGSVFQDPRWAAVKKGWSGVQIYLEEDNKITAGMSMLIKKTGPFSMMYAPRGPVCNPLDKDTVNRLLKEALPEAKKNRAFVLRMDPVVLYDDEVYNDYIKQGFIVRGRGFLPRDLIQPRLNMVLTLNGETADSLFPKFSRTGRNYIRAAEKENVSVRSAKDEKTLARFYELYAGTASRKRFGKRSFSYFKGILDTFEGARIFIAEHEGDILSGELCIYYGDTVWCAYSGTSQKKPRIRANSLMRWEMIKWAIDLGCKRFDFGGVFAADKSDGLYEHKERFCRKDGCTEYIGELDYVYKPLVYKCFLQFAPFVLKVLRRLKKRLLKLKNKENSKADDRQDGFV